MLQNNKNVESPRTTFSNRLRDLMEANGIKQGDLQEEFAVSSSQAVGNYVNDKRSPNAEQIVAIAKRFHVSADYLVGLSDVPTLDLKKKAICDATGLHEITLSKLKNETYKYIKPYEIVNLLFSPDHHFLINRYMNEILLAIVTVARNTKFDPSADRNKDIKTKLYEEYTLDDQLARRGQIAVDNKYAIDIYKANANEVLKLLTDATIELGVQHMKATNQPTD